MGLRHDRMMDLTHPSIYTLLRQSIPYPSSFPSPECSSSDPCAPCGLNHHLASPVERLLNVKRISYVKCFVMIIYTYFQMFYQCPAPFIAVSQSSAVHPISLVLRTYLKTNCYTNSYPSPHILVPPSLPITKSTYEYQSYPYRNPHPIIKPRLNSDLILNHHPPFFAASPFPFHRELKPGDVYSCTCLSFPRLMAWLLPGGV
jgi:hypothetical protein